MRSLALFFAVVILLAFAASARAERRVALVIGEGAYEHADKLANPLTDARNMRDALRRIEFAEADIVYGENLNKRDLERMIGRFATLARGADVALAFYAGHGATFGDTPYIVPVDARFDSMDQMPYELTPLENMIGELRKAKGVRIAIIDACRDNSAEKELKRQDARGGEITRGLAPPKNPEGLILAYATQYLLTAADGPSGGDSPFTAALLKHLPTPGLDVKQLFFEVGAEVLRTTGGKQRPEVKVSFFDRYALVPTKEGAGEAKPASSADTLAADFWAAKRLGTALDWKDFLDRHPSGPLADLAREELEKLSRPQLAAVTPAAPVVPRPSGPCGGATLASLSARSPAPLSANEECALVAKAEFQECETCPKMVVVPTGSFTMGSPKGEAGRYGHEGPQHAVTISRPFAVGKFEVSFEEWDACVADGGCGGHRPNDNGWGRGRLPVINVSWSDARAYASWLSRKTGRSYRLLSETEWEYAARGGTTTPFWWGSSISTAQANYLADFDAVVNGTTVAVDSFAPNAFGLYNVHGNVWEWVEDCWNDNYRGAPADGSAWTAKGCAFRVVRGGSWDVISRNLRAANRNGEDPRLRDGYTGLRLARTLTR